MKFARATALLLLGLVLGAATVLAVQHMGRAQRVRALPSLADRTSWTATDENSYITLRRRNGAREYEVHDGMGGSHKDFQTLLALEREFWDGDPLWAINFEPGVSVEDLDRTVETLSGLGVKRYLLGNSIYGKSILKP